MAEPLFPAVDAHVIDTNLFIEFERANAISLLERAVTDHGVVLLCPSRVYDELTPETAPYEVLPIDIAIEAGWVQVLEEIDCHNRLLGFVSSNHYRRIPTLCVVFNRAQIPSTLFRITELSTLKSPTGMVLDEIPR